MNGNIVSPQGGAGCFYHHAKAIGKVSAFINSDRRRNSIDLGFNQLHFATGRHKWDHDFRHHRCLTFACFDRGFKNSAGLHFIDFRNRKSQPNAPHPQHRIVLTQRLNPTGDVRQRQVERLGKIAQSCPACR